MTSSPITLLASLLTGQADAQPGVPGWVIVVVLGLVAAALAAGWLAIKLRDTRRRLETLAVEHKTTAEAHRALMDKERKQGKSLEGQRSDLSESKHELAAQRKKTHTAQEENKRLREELRSRTEELQKARNTKAAFEERPRGEPKPEPKAQLKPEPKPEAKAEPSPEPQAVPPSAPAAAPVDSELLHKLSRLEAENRTLAEGTEAYRKSLRETREELTHLRKRVEAFRRIDLVAKGRVEVLEDKIAGLGRQYYDAVSELAALKGEVKPPPPRDLRALAPQHPGDEAEALSAAQRDDADEENVPEGFDPGAKGSKSGSAEESVS